MAFEMKPGSGTLFRNDKDGNDKRPDYRGELKLADGEVIKLAGWIKEGAKGKFLSLSVDKPKEQSDAAFPSSRDEGFSGDNRHGKGQDAGRRAAYEASQRDDPFGEPPF